MIDLSTLYHYTNSQGLLGIIDKKSNRVVLWFTNYKYLNDSSEGLELQRIYKITIEKMYKEGNLSKEEFDDIVDVNFDDKHMYAYATMENEKPVTKLIEKEDVAFVCCFSKNKDSLNMWRYYTNNEIGFGIGFNDIILKKETSIDTFSSTETRIGEFEWIDVIYNDKEKIHIVQEIILRVKQEQKNYGSFYDFKDMIYSHLKKYKFSFKHQCFMSEEEVRCVLTIPRDNQGFSGKRPFEVLYRCRNGNITPYIAVFFSKKVLYSVRISPTAPSETQETINYYLSTYSPKVIVEKSQLPIRF